MHTWKKVRQYNQFDKKADDFGLTLKWTRRCYIIRSFTTRMGRDWLIPGNSNGQCKYSPTKVFTGLVFTLKELPANILNFFSILLGCVTRFVYWIWHFFQLYEPAKKPVKVTQPLKRTKPTNLSATNQTNQPANQTNQSTNQKLIVDFIFKEQFFWTKQVKKYRLKIYNLIVSTQGVTTIKCNEED